MARRPSPEADAMNGEDPSVPRRDKGKQKAVDQDEVSDDPDSEEPRASSMSLAGKQAWKAQSPRSRRRDKSAGPAGTIFHRLAGFEREDTAPSEVQFVEDDEQYAAGDVTAFESDDRRRSKRFKKDQTDGPEYTINLTPIVHRVAQPYFRARCLGSASPQFVAYNPRPIEDEAHPDFSYTGAHFKLPGCPGKSFYSEAKVGARTIRPGDFVLVGEEGSESSSRSVDESYHWMRVERIFKEDWRQWVHGVYLDNSTDTILGPLGNPNELFETLVCGNALLSNVVRTESIQVCGPGEDPSPGSLFTRFLYDPHTGAFRNPGSLPTLHSSVLRPDGILCPTCEASYAEQLSGRARSRRSERSVDWLRDAQGQALTGQDFGILVGGEEEYRLGDTVYYSVDGDMRALIGKVVEICGISQDDVDALEAPNGRRSPTPDAFVRLERRPDAGDTAPLVTVIDMPRIIETHDSRFADPWRLCRPRRTSRMTCIDARTHLEGHVRIIAVDKEIFEEPKVMSERTGAVQDHRRGDAEQDGPHDAAEARLAKEAERLIKEQKRNKEAKRNEFLREYVYDREDTFFVVVGKDPPAFSLAPSAQRQLALEHDDHLNSVSIEPPRNADLGSDAKPRKLRHLDLCAGIGSFSLGLEDVGLSSTEHTTFIDIDRASARTLGRNFRHDRVICQEMNNVLELIYKGDGHTETIQDGLDKRPLTAKDLPRPGEVDLITAGFPCQGHSQANAYAQSNQLSNQLAATTMAYVELYRPKYFIAEENLPASALVFTNLQRVSGGPEDPPIKTGYLRFLLQSLVTLGYQVSFGVLNAAHFGTPQARRRLILLAAQQGVTLPKLPQPTHTFGDQHLPIRIPDTNIEATHITRRAAPHDHVTVYEAVSDLQPWEYRIDGEEVSSRIRAQVHQRLKDPDAMPVDPADPKAGGLLDRNPYFQPPFTVYQEEMRRGSKWQRNHITGSRSDLLAQRIWHLPIEPGADWRHLQPYADRLRLPKNLRPGNFERLDTDGVFPTIMTRMEPTNRNGVCIHPAQHRILTCLEAQRAQGIPDRYKLRGRDNPDPSQEYYRLIGNAIPIPLTRALARELLKAMVQDWQESERRQPMNGGSVL